MPKPKPKRLLAIDTSASPGFAVLDFIESSESVKAKAPKLVYADALKTDNNKPDSERYAAIEAMTSLICFKYGPFDAVAREHFTKGGSKRSTQLVFGAWSAVDSALGRFGYHIDVDSEVTPSAVKKAATGKGKAEKHEVEAGVRSRLKLPDDYVFANNGGGDSSDAVAVGLAYLLSKGLID